MPKYKPSRSFRRNLFANDDKRTANQLCFKEDKTPRVIRRKKTVTTKILPNSFLGNDISDTDELKSHVRTLPDIDCWQSSDDLRNDKENCSEIRESSPETGGFLDLLEKNKVSPVIRRCSDDDDTFSITSECGSPKTPNKCAKTIRDDPDGHINDIFSSPTCSDIISLSTAPSPTLGKNTIKSSDWFKNLGTSRTTPDKIPNNIKVHCGSDRKRQKCVKGGLAEKLEKLTRREQADYAIWRHQRQKSSEIVDKSKALKLKITNLRKEFSHFYTRCEIFSNSNEANNQEEQFILILPLALKVKLKLETGNSIEIYPPWKTLKISRNETYILCANYIDVIDRSTEYFPLISECIYQHRCSCSSDKSIDSVHCSNLNVRSRTSATSAFKTGSTQREIKNLVTKPINSVLDALKMSNFSLTARLRRLFYYNHDDSKIKKWSFLIEDANGFYAEIYSEEFLSDDQLSIIKQHSEGNLLAFEQLRFQKKISSARYPALFSIIHTQQEIFGQNNPPNYQQFSYLLLMTRLSTIHKCESSSVHLFTKEIKSITETLQSTSEGFRCSFFAKILFKHREKLFLSDETCVSEDKHEQYIKILMTPAVIQCENLNAGCVVLLKDVYKNLDCLLLDKYSRIQCFTCGCEELNEQNSIKIEETRFELLKNLTPELKIFTSTCASNELVIVSGVILKPNEDDSYSWEVCDICANPSLHEKTTGLFCDRCNYTVINPIVKIHMEVFLHCWTVPPESHVKLTLNQITIEQILPGFTNNEQYDVECITNKPIGPLKCYVQDVSFQDGHSTVKIYTLQEI